MSLIVYVSFTWWLLIGDADQVVSSMTYIAILYIIVGI